VRRLFRTAILTVWVVPAAIAEGSHTQENLRYQVLLLRAEIPMYRDDLTRRLMAMVSDAHESSILAEYFFASKPPSSTRALLGYTGLLPPLIFRCATVFYATRRHSPLLARGRTPRRPLTRLVLDSPTRVHHWPWSPGRL
jgi:hypothetical protein